MGHNDPETPPAVLTCTNCMGITHTVSFDIHINANSGVPLYRQIADEVKSARLRGYLAPGAKLPSVRELAAKLAINPTTVVKAYDVLANERVIVRRQGRGAFISDDVQPLRPREKREMLEQLAAKLAIEGRRLGLSEEEIAAMLAAELERLRPRKENES